MARGGAWSPTEGSSCDPARANGGSHLGPGLQHERLDRSRAQSPDFSAEIVLVLSDDQAAARPCTRAQAGRRRPRRSTLEPYAGKPAFEAALGTRLPAASVEIVCLAGFMRVLSPPFVERWKGRAAGTASIPRSCRTCAASTPTSARSPLGSPNMAARFGLVTPQLDAGPILAQARAPVLPGDDVAALAARVLKEEHRIYPQAHDENWPARSSPLVKLFQRR